MALDLGFLHPDLMLARLTARQWREVNDYISYMAELRERLRAEAEDSRLYHHMTKVIAQQEREKHGKLGKR